MRRGKESGRIDDNLTAISNRIKFYKYNTLPVMKYFDDLGKLVVVSMGHSPTCVCFLAML